MKGYVPIIMTFILKKKKKNEKKKAKKNVITFILLCQKTELSFLANSVVVLHVFTFFYKNEPYKHIVIPYKGIYMMLTRYSFL